MLGAPAKHSLAGVPTTATRKATISFISSICLLSFELHVFLHTGNAGVPATGVPNGTARGGGADLKRTPVSRCEAHLIYPRRLVFRLQRRANRKGLLPSRRMF